MILQNIWKAHKNLRTIVRLLSDMDASKGPNPKVIKEGKAEILLSTDNVFYNPVQEFNRDLSIAALTVFSVDFVENEIVVAQKKAAKKIKDCDDQSENKDDLSQNLVTVLEPLSATGLRAIRYAKEVPNVTRVVANDISQAAVMVINENIVHNKVEKYVEASCEDATILMYRHKDRNKRFTVIDLDPYGCPSMFLDSAVQAVQDGGMLLITATDMAVLAGNSPETCYVKYGAVSLKTKCCHEMALRILLQCVQAHANRYGRYIEPLLSVSVDFYIRVFVRVRTGLLHCKKTTSLLSMVHHCTGCGNLVLQPLGGFRPNPTDKNPRQMKAYLPTGPFVGPYCLHCNQTHQMGGPIWSGPIHDQAFVSKILTHVWKYPSCYGTAKRIEGVLSMIKEEIDVPLYYTVDKLFGTVHLESMKMVILRSAILNAGYNVSYSHASKHSVKTDAPASLVWDIVRTWELDHPVAPKRRLTDPVTNHILSQKITHNVNLTINLGANPNSRRDHCLRFQGNPAPNWGPGTRCKINDGNKKKSKQKPRQKRRRTMSESDKSIEQGCKKRSGSSLSECSINSDGNTASDGNATD